LFGKNDISINLFNFSNNIIDIVSKRKYFNYYEFFNCLSQITSTLTNSLTPFELEFFANLKYIFINIDKFDNLYNLFEVTKFDTNKNVKKILF